MSILDIILAGLGGLVTLGAMATAIAYLLAQIRRGRDQEQVSQDEKHANSIALANQEIDLLKTRETRLQDDLEEARREHREYMLRANREIAKLSGQVDQLRRENHDLRQLIIGERVPKAMRDAMHSAVAEAMHALQDELNKLRDDVLITTLEAVRPKEAPHA